MKKYFFMFASVLIGVFLALILGEVALRIRHPGNSSDIISLDDKLGWRATNNYEFHGQKIDSAGQKYQVDISTNKDGFRIFGNPDVINKKKVFFIGDSFTQAAAVSNSKTYYGLLQSTLPIEVFAYGGGGYGTLQEYMILDRYIDIIKPDIMVIQFSSNDFINNSYELERRSYRNNNGMRRPYMTKDGKIEYKLPKRFPQFRELINKYSRFLYRLTSKFDQLSANKQNSVEDTIEKYGKSYPFYNDSIEITEQIIENIKNRVPNSTTILAFSVNDTNPYYDGFKRISSKYGISFIDGIPQAIKRAEQNGIVVTAADGSHWNENGHAIAADVLSFSFR